LGERWSSKTESAVPIHLRRWLRMLILIMILYMTGVNSYLCLFIGIGGGSLLVWQTFSLNKKVRRTWFDESGTKKRHPRYIICRKPVHRYFQLNSKMYQRWNKSKATTLESKFPLLAVENNCIISKDADITACFRVQLPELLQ
jgi:hypothetical protein